MGHRGERDDRRVTARGGETSGRSFRIEAVAERQLKA
jgi:hypothetical protein